MPRKTNNSQPSRQQQPSVDTLAAAAGVLAQTANGTVLGGPPRDAGGRGGTGRGGVPSDINDILQVRQGCLFGEDTSQRCQRPTPCRAPHSTPHPHTPAS